MPVTEATRAFLVALTAEGKEALHGAEKVIAEFPFRVGRESRKFESRENKASFADKRNPANRPNNDLYLVEEIERINVSREHFQIAREGAGFVLEDRGSTLGTIVEGQKVGGDRRGGRVALKEGDVIIVGASVSPHVYKFRVR
jgi:pSer/pThr/pTyr-binding forkhead associated (FHA) protein